ncbi:MAG: glycosyltransferase family 4 protein [Magnetococcales bacterium]|nr:glycosyltransferase family 4 protein [Magnetococcales bacterium]
MSPQQNSAQTMDPEEKCPPSPTGKIALFYHFFHPDDVVSARLFSDLARGLLARGWEVTVHTSNRIWSDPSRRIEAATEQWEGVHIIRTSRPGLEQGGYVLRLLNALWMMLGWIWRVGRSPQADLFLVGTDPQFSQLLLPLLKLVSPRTRVAWWCFDLYPEAIAADRPGSLLASLARASRHLMGPLYRCADLVVDIGPCMRRRLATYKQCGRPLTLTPWALVEPKTIDRPDPTVRTQLFGADCQLALLYSGSMGRAHDFDLFLALMRRLRHANPFIRLVFSCRGNRLAALQAAVGPDDGNISFAPFASEAELAQRLAAADMHLLSLRPDWDGIVVPSKFFGSLATGRPLLYVGSEQSSVGQWIEEFAVGLRVDPHHVDLAATRLLELARQPAEMVRWQHNAFAVYHRHFSRQVILDGWNLALRDLMPRPQP